MSSRDLLKEFRYDEPAATSGGSSVALGGTPVVIAVLSGCDAFRRVRRYSRVLLGAVVGWQATANGTGTTRTDVLFEIHRYSPSGPLVYSAVDSSESAFDKLEVSPLSHVDRDADGHCVSYFLLASAPLPGSAALVVGPVTFTGLLIQRAPCSYR